MEFLPSHDYCLLFVLLVLTLYQGECTHCDEERVSDERKKASENGYVLVQVFGFWEYSVTKLKDDWGPQFAEGII